MKYLIPILIFFGVLFVPAVSHAGGRTASTSATTAVNHVYNIGDGPGVDWTNPSYVTSSDNLYASTTAISPLLTPSYSAYNSASGFGFAIPTGSTIDGIVVEIEKSASSNGTDYWTDASVLIVQDGVEAGTEHADTTTKWGTTDAYKRYGSSTDLWGLTWTAEQINASNFGVSIAGKPNGLVATSGKLDHTRITIYYTPPWYDASYGYRVRFDVNPANVSSTQVNFPVFVSSTAAGLAFTDYAGGHMGSSTAADVLMVDQNGFSTPREIDYYTSSTGAIGVWALSPSSTAAITNTATTSFWMYYGSSTASNNVNTTSTWLNSYTEVWHLKESPTAGAPQFVDSSPAPTNSATASGTASTAGFFGNGLSQLSTSTAQGFKFTTSTPSTISLWMKPNVNSAPTFGALVNSAVGRGGYGGLYYKAATTNVGKVAWVTVNTEFIPTTSVLSTSTWNYIVWNKIGTTNYMYFNGSLQNSAAFTLVASSTQFGYQGTADKYSGWVDEVRLNSTALSASYIKTEYNNQSSPGTFYVTNAEETNVVSSSSTTPIEIIWWW